MPTLREAQQRPQDFTGLVVRVAGYSAFFVELSKEIRMTSFAAPRINCEVIDPRGEEVAYIQHSALLTE